MKRSAKTKSEREWIAEAAETISPGRGIAQSVRADFNLKHQTLNFKPICCTPTKANVVPPVCESAGWPSLLMNSRPVGRDWLSGLHVMVDDSPVQEAGEVL